MAAIEQDNNARLDYSIDWAALVPGADTISSSTYTVSPADDTNPLTVSNTSISGKTTIFWVSGGNVGQLYTVANRVTTSAGRTDEWSLQFKIVGNQFLC